MTTQSTYKKFKTLDQLYSYIHKIQPNMENWACRGPIQGTGQADTRVWPEEFGGGKNGFYEAFRYVCGDFLDGNNFKPGVSVYIDLNDPVDGKISIGYVGATILDGDRQYSFDDILRSVLNYESENSFFGPMDFDGDDKEIFPIEEIPQNLFTPQLLAKIFTAANDQHIALREVLEILPATAFSSQVKKALLDNDPDAIFYINPESLNDGDALYAIDRAATQGGFSSVMSDQPEELPGNLPQKIMTPRVIQALKTKLNIPDDAFQNLSEVALDRIKQLSGLK